MNPFIPATPPSDATLRVWWTEASNASVVECFGALHEYSQHVVDEQRPVCLASGKCCNFHAHGHILVVTALEALWVWRHAHSSLRRSHAQTAQAAGTCAFLKGSLCSIHASRPTGCRSYFCDRGDGIWQSTLSERMHESITQLHAERNIPYLYAEWTWLVAQIAQADERGVFSEAVTS